MLLLIQMALLCAGWSRGQILMEELTASNIDPMTLNGTEPFTNLTLDQLLMRALGGLELASNLVMRDDGLVLAELDMLVTKEQFYSIYEPPQQRGGGHKRKKRKAAKDVNVRWTNNEIPYRFAPNHFSSFEIAKIRSAMTEWEKYTCLNFRESNVNDRNLVQFQNGRGGCSSQLGMVGGVQGLNLDRNGCRYRGLYLHEIGHAIGLVHEHQLPERDNYIEIIWQNVMTGYEFCFDKYTTAFVDTMNVKYEYSSIMHYGVTAFSGNNKPTIRSKQPDKDKIIGRVFEKELGFSDVKIVNFMYNCADHCDGSVQCDGDGFLDQNCRCICPDGTDSCTRGKSAQHDASCVNQDDWQCAIKANNGECERNPGLMTEKCRKACGFCGRQEPISNVCTDLFSTKKCEVWKARGECHVNQKWMAKNCKKTCKACNGESDTSMSCQNKHPNNEECDKWAQEGECESNPRWMPFNCQKSCRMCDITPTMPPTTTPAPDDGSCMNEHNDVSCVSWAKGGECEINPGWMIPNCKKACGRCSSAGDCRNSWDDTECEMWAMDNECNKNSEWMTNNCYLSCNKEQCQGKTTLKTTPATTRPQASTSSGGGGGTCVNNHKKTEECNAWAAHGHCDRNKWMLINCARACNRCPEQTTPSTPTKPTTPAVCKDLEGLCPEWKKHGYCRDNPAVGLKVCKEFCGGCSLSGTCKDENQLCSVWAKAGYCSSNEYVLKNCRLSCDRC